jgi:integrase
MDWSTLKEILDAIPPDDIGMRDKAILLFYAFTGRRRAEVAQLRVRDLDLKTSPPTYSVKLKGGRVGQFELPDVCYEAIRAYWIAADRLRGLQPNAGVFTASRSCPLTEHLDPDRPLSNRMMNNILQRAVLRAGLDPSEESMCIHAIRHMSARDLDKAGVRLQDIQSFLGHASPVTTQIYLDRLRGPAPAHTDVLMKVREEAMKMARGLQD